MPYNIGEAGLERIGRVKPVALNRIPAMKNYWNAGVNMAYRRGTKQQPISPSSYDYYNAGVNVAYGNVNQASNQLGDLFNDIMGAVVPGWDARPDWMKKIVVKPDPQKIIQTAQQVAPQAAGNIVKAANDAGVNVFYNTPAGQIPVTPGMAQGAYSGLPFMASMSSIPSTVWIAGGAGLLLLVMFAAKK